MPHGAMRAAPAPAAPALEDAQRMLEDLLLKGPVATSSANNPDSGWPRFQGEGEGSGVEIITFDSSSEGGSNVDESSGSGGGFARVAVPPWPGAGDGGGSEGEGLTEGAASAWGGPRRAALDASIAALAAAATPVGSDSPTHRAAAAGGQSEAKSREAAAAAALRALAVPWVDAEDLLGCDNWPLLCRALPACLLGNSIDSGSSSSDSSGVAAGATAVLRLLERELLEGAAAPLAQLLAPLLHRLAYCGVSAAALAAAEACACSADKAVAAAGGAGCAHTAAAEADPGPGTAAPAEMKAELATLVFVLRSLHTLGQEWHFVPGDLADPLAGEIADLALQCKTGGGASYRNSSRREVRGGDTGGSVVGSGDPRVPALQALLALEPDMVWWHRLFALAGFKRLLSTDAVAAYRAAGSSGGG